jgi:hypothetical protein
MLDARMAEIEVIVPAAAKAAAEARQRAPGVARVLQYHYVRRA